MFTNAERDDQVNTNGGRGNIRQNDTSKGDTLSSFLAETTSTEVALSVVVVSETMQGSLGGGSQWWIMIENA